MTWNKLYGDRRTLRAVFFNLFWFTTPYMTKIIDGSLYRLKITIYSTFIGKTSIKCRKLIFGDISDTSWWRPSWESLTYTNQTCSFSGWNEDSRVDGSLPSLGDDHWNGFNHSQRFQSGWRNETVSVTTSKNMLFQMFFRREKYTLFSSTWKDEQF